MAKASPDSLFVDRPDIYDAMIDWPTRLKREEPLFRWLFDEVDARRVLDVACGTGRHAALFHRWGLDVEGADVSPAMIAHCKKTHGESETLRWTCRSFDQPADSDRPFDAVLCKGNSLALAPDAGTVNRAVQSMMAALRPGGVCFIHLLNISRYPCGPTQWQKKQRVTLEKKPWFLLKGIHRHQDDAWLETVVIQEGADPVRTETHASRLLLLDYGTMATLLLEHGADRVASYGSVKRDPYRQAESPDLVLVTQKV